MAKAKFKEGDIVSKGNFSFMVVAVNEGHYVLQGADGMNIKSDIHQVDNGYHCANGKATPQKREYVIDTNGDVMRVPLPN